MINVGWYSVRFVGSFGCSVGSGCHYCRGGTLFFALYDLVVITVEGYSVFCSVGLGCD